jgi:protein-tyrosine-phosphatase
MAGAMLAAAPVTIVTAGTHVLEGQPMGRRTRDALEATGTPVPLHRSHQLTDGDVAVADLVIAMATEHVAYIRRAHPDAAARTGTIRRLCRDLPDTPEPLATRVATLGLADVELETWEDVDDPAGGEDEVYVACAADLLRLTTELLSRLR